MTEQIAKVTITIDDLPDEEINWESYAFNQDFFIPTAAFRFRVGVDKITYDVISKYQAGRLVKLKLSTEAGEKPISTGYIDQVRIVSDRGGSFLEIHGRDILAQPADAGINPLLTFKDGQTLGDVIGESLGPFGLNIFYTSDAQSREIATGINKTKAKPKKVTYKTKTTTGLLQNNVREIEVENTITVYEDPTAPKSFIKEKIKKLNPMIGESCLEFAIRNAKRFGLYIWAASNGSGVIVGKPVTSGNPSYELINNRIIRGYDGSNNNVINAEVSFDYMNQPAVIIAKGFAGGGDFKNTRIKVAKVNEFIGYDGSGNVLPVVQGVIDKVPGVSVLKPVDSLVARNDYFGKIDHPKAVYFEDDNSKTLEQLEGFVDRKMSEYQRTSMVLRYTVNEHHQNGVPYVINEIVRVEDTSLNIVGNFWIKGITFRKSRNGGATTDLELIPLGVAR